MRRSPLRSILIAATALGPPGLWRAPTSTSILRTKTVFAAGEAPATCSAIDKSWVQIDVPVAPSNETPAVGRFFRWQ